MARKDVFKNALESLINPATPAPRPAGKSILQSATLGAVDSSLARSLQLAELDPSSISDSEFEDRLPYGPEDLEDLVTSIRENGQQIPILVHRAASGQYQIIYGRRRLAAIRQLGMKVRALITEMDDQQRIIAQGIENSVRRDLSFIEKAIFAHRLRGAGIEEATIRQALNIDIGAPKATTISTMKMVIEALSEDVIHAIGRAPGIGRPRWRALAELYREKSRQFPDLDGAALAQLAIDVELTENEDDHASDQRFMAIYNHLTALGAEKVANTPRPTAGSQDVVVANKAVATVKHSKAGPALQFSAKQHPEFASWVEAHAEDLIRELYDQFTQDRTAATGGT